MECANSKKSKIKTDEEVEFVKFKNINGSYLALQGILSLSKSKEDDDIQTFIKKKVHKIPKKLLDCTFIADPIEVKECFDLPNGNKNADV